MGVRKQDEASVEGTLGSGVGGAPFCLLRVAGRGNPALNTRFYLTWG